MKHVCSMLNPIFFSWSLYSPLCWEWDSVLHIYFYSDFGNMLSLKHFTKSFITNSWILPLGLRYFKYNLCLFLYLLLQTPSWSPSEHFHEFINPWHLHITSKLHHFFILHHLFETKDQYLSLGPHNSSSCSSDQMYFPSSIPSKQNTTMIHAYFSTKQNITHLQKEETKCIIFKVFTFSLLDVEMRSCMKTWFWIFFRFQMKL